MSHKITELIRGKYIMHEGEKYNNIKIEENPRHSYNLNISTRIEAGQVKVKTWVVPTLGNVVKWSKVPLPYYTLYFIDYTRHTRLTDIKIILRISNISIIAKRILEEWLEEIGERDVKCEV